MTSAAVSVTTKRTKSLALNIPLIQERMRKQGLSCADVADRLKVSREAVSAWLNGEYVPRPAKALRLAMLLQLSYHELFGLPLPTEDEAPVQVLYVGRTGRVALEDKEQLELKLGGLGSIEDFFAPPPVFAPAIVTKPELSKRHLDEVARSARVAASVRDQNAVNATHLLKLLKDVRACVFPSRMARREANTWTTVSRLNGSKRLVVHFPLFASHEAQLRGLAEAYGVCLSWHALPAQEARRYGQELATRLLSPDSVFDLGFTDDNELRFYEQTQAYGMTEVTDALEHMQELDGGRNAARVSESLLMNVLDGWAFAGMLIPEQRARRRAELEHAAQTPALPETLRVLASPKPEEFCALVLSLGLTRPLEHWDALQVELARQNVKGKVLFDYLLPNGTLTRRFFMSAFDGKEFENQMSVSKVESISPEVQETLKDFYREHQEQLDLSLLKPHRFHEMYLQDS